MNCMVVKRFLLLSALIATAFAQESQPSKNFDPSQEAFVINAIKTSVRFENDGSSVEIFQRRLKVQNAAGVKQAGILFFDYMTSQTMNIDYVEVHKPDGSVIKVGPENARDTTPPIDREAPMYSDLHRKEVTVTGLNVGDELVTQSTYKSASLIPGQFWFEHSFNKDQVVLSEIIQINVPKGRKIRVKSAPEYKPEIKDDGDRSIYVWTASHPKLKEEKEGKTGQSFYDLLAAARKTPAPDILLSTFSSWEEIASWYGGLQKDRVTPGPAVKAKALELTKGLTTPDAKLKAIYEFVATNFRYISIDFGIGRYQPHTAEEVLSNGYGDCKDKHTLMAAMLQAVGIDSVPALMNSERLIDPDVPSPAQFDHVITAIPRQNSFLFLDTTQETAPFGLLYFTLRGRKALLVLPEHGGRFGETPLNPSGPSGESFDLNGKVDSSGTLDADVTVRFRGDSEIVLGAAFRNTPPSKYKELVQTFSYASGFAGEVSDVKVINDPAGGFGYSYHYHRPNYYDFSDKRPAKSVPLVVALAEMDSGQESLTLYFAPGELLYKCRVEVPQGVSPSTPLPVKLERSYAHFESKYSVEKNVITAEKRLTILKPQITASQQPDYESFRKAVASDEAQDVILHPGPGFEAKTAAMSSSDLDELMQQGEFSERRNDYQAAYNIFQKVARQDPTHKGVWRQLGYVETMMNRREEGIRDFQKQVEVDPFDALAYAQLGWSYFNARKNTEGLAALKKAIEIDPLNHAAHNMLGFYYFGNKDYVNAAPELEKSLATGSEAGDESSTLPMLATCWFELKQPEKAAELLGRLVEASPEPRTWNAAAYQMAENNFQLDKAKEYAQLAIKTLNERLTSVDESAFNATDMNNTSLLSQTWDTLGWIYFKSGDAARAEKYVYAAWILSQNETIGEHLGEIYEKLGRTQDAIRFYAMSSKDFFSIPSQGPAPSDPARVRLVKLAGRVRAQSLVEKYHSDPSQMRTFHLGRIAPSGSKAELLFVFGAGPKIEAMHMLNGDNAVLESLKKSALPIGKMISFPEDAPVKLVRQGFLNCSRYTQGCDLVLNIVGREITVTRSGEPLQINNE